jgi:hypothetical protein
MRDLNPKAAADSWGTFNFKWPFSRLLILSVVLHTFLKLITLIKSPHLRMNPTTCSTNLKKIHLFL